MAETKRPRGRPPLPQDERKMRICLRLAPWVVTFYQDDLDDPSPGWTGRMEDALQKAAMRQLKKLAKPEKPAKRPKR
jgi:uncharacterized protein (DUF4415 family)